MPLSVAVVKLGGGAALEFFGAETPDFGVRPPAAVAGFGIFETACLVWSNVGQAGWWMSSFLMVALNDPTIALSKPSARIIPVSRLTEAGLAG